MNSNSDPEKGSATAYEGCPKPNDRLKLSVLEDARHFALDSWAADGRGAPIMERRVQKMNIKMVRIIEKRRSYKFAQ